MRYPYAIILPLLLLAAVAVPAFAEHPPVRVIRLDQPINVDGQLDEAVWQNGHGVSSFTQRDPDQGLPPRQRTEVRIAYDDDAIYVGARLFDTAPDSIVARLSRRDNDPGSDNFCVMLDPYRDRRTGYYFMVTAAGVLLDGVMMNDGWDDSSWDGVWQARTRRDEQGWTAEMKIPFSQMRYRAGPQVVWGVNFQRSINRYVELDALVYTPRGGSGYVSRFPELQGLDDLKTGQHVEVTPYVTSKTENLTFDSNTLGEYDPSDPYHNGWSSTPNVGGDLRANVGSKLTLNATVNPDFGQVEIDPAVVNLTDVESFFQEKRPFFTEGVSVFRCGNNGANDYWGFNWPEPVFFYSRRIGRAPRGDTPQTEDFSEAPLGTSILGAAKLTGQAAPGWNVGTVQAVTQREVATLNTGGTESKYGIEPLSYYGVYRVMHEMNDRRQGLGVMAMTTAASFEGADDPLQDVVNDASVVTAVDGWTFLDKKRVWVISGYGTGSWVHGSEARMTSLQQSFPQYYQRPDRPDLGVDPNATSLAGWGGRLWLNKQEGAFMLNSAFGMLAPGFNNNDLGFQFGGDVMNGHLGMGYQWEKPSGNRHYANVLGALAGSWDFGGNNSLHGVYLSGNFEQRNRWSWYANTFMTGESFSPTKTRGGPIMTRKPAVSVGMGFDTNSRKPWFWAINYNPFFSQDGSWEQQISPSFVWRPIPNLGLSGGPELYQAHYDTQWEDNDGTLATGTRFTELEQTQWSMNFRVDYSATPNLSLQVYVQPLISTLRFHNLRELARSRSYEFITVDGAYEYGYTYGSVRGNAVLRWEYLPGSSMYFVWSQDRQATDGNMQFDPGESYKVASTAPVNNVFLVKVAHHFHL